LAKAIKEAHPQVKITYYILPQVWAWKAKRAAKVEAYCDNLASILPFESRWYPSAVFVGHPLLDEIKEVKTSLTCKGKIAFLPGSRPKEIARLMPLFKEVANALNKEAQLVIPPFIDPENIPLLYGDITGFTPVFNTHKALFESDFAFVCSGTATLEAALIGTPFVLAYRAHWFDFAVAKRLVKLPYVGLANIILGFMGKAPLHEELLQDAVCVQSLLEAYARMDGSVFLERSKALGALLEHGSAEHVAAMIRV
jgi:lipid-A-disaccharide synthase